MNFNEGATQTSRPGQRAALLARTTNRRRSLADGHLGHAHLPRLGIALVTITIGGPLRGYPVVPYGTSVIPSVTLKDIKA